MLNLIIKGDFVAIQTTLEVSPCKLGQNTLAVFQNHPFVHKKITKLNRESNGSYSIALKIRRTSQTIPQEQMTTKDTKDKQVAKAVSGYRSQSVFDHNE